jgi:hypothetical protein
MKDLSRFLGAALLVLLAMLLTLKLKAILGWSPDLILPVLVVAAFLLDIYALAFLVLLGVWVLNWQTGLPLELLVLAAVPLAAWFGKRFLPPAPWLTLAAAIAAGELLLYAAAAPGAFFGHIVFILANAAFAVLLGLGLLNLVEYVYGPE